MEKEFKGIKTLIHSMEKIISEPEKMQNIILIIPDEKYKETITNLIKELVGLKKTVCFVSVNKTKNALEKELKEKKVSTEKVYFVDCVSKSISKGRVKWSDEKTQYIDNPTSLTQMSLAIFNLFERVKIDFFVLDSINTLLIYNTEKDILKFVHHTTGKLKESSQSGIFVFLKQETNEKLLKEFAQFTDKIVQADVPQKEFKKSGEGMDAFEEIKL